MTTTTAGENEKRSHRTKRQDDEEIRLIRSHRKTRQTFIGPLGWGGCDMLPP